MSSTPAGESNNHYHLADIRILQSEPLINYLPHSNQQQHYHNSNINLNNQDTACIKRVKPVISKTSFLASVMVEQPIIQAAISSIDTFNNTKTSLNFG